MQLPQNGTAADNEQRRQIHRIIGDTFKKPHPPLSRPKRALIVSKSSLLEYEFERPRNAYTDFDDPRFIQDLKKKYANIDDLKKRHELQQQYVNAISQELERQNIECRVVRRRKYTDELVNWSDLIISAGGDGTFLTAAKRVPNGDKPVIGINTDPVGSEGFLCMTGKSRHPADEVIGKYLEKCTSPDFNWMWRQRIRITLTNPGFTETISTSPSSSSIIQQQSLENGKKKQTVEDDEEDLDEDGDEAPKSRKSKFSSDSEDETEAGLLMSNSSAAMHRLALNEVFIGESHAARVSYYDVQVDNGPMIKQKSSGMTICTGTGSTSWHYNINRLTEQTLSEVLTVMNRMGLNLDREVNDELLEQICRQFNDQLKFRPELPIMAFSVRDPVFNATFPKTLIRGFATKIRLKSRCTNAHLILDGSTSIPFNRGAEVLLEIHPEDALRTAVLEEHNKLAKNYL